ncbi:MAG: hypothetical protein K8R36_05865 [Planctomycetales bacterium]|nr:hypothetical protein [Planctomycetales bacterium]
MPKVRYTSIDIEGRAFQIADVLLAAAQPPDDLPLVDSVESAVEIVRGQQAQSFVCFRFSDDPSITVVWQHHRTAAVVFTVLNRRHFAHADVVLLGMNADDDQRALQAARRALGLTETEVAAIANEKRPTLAQFNPSPNGEKGWAEVLGLVMFVPAMCGVGGVR